MTAKQEAEDGTEEVTDGVIIHTETGIDGAVAGLGSNAVVGCGLCRLLCAAGNADAVLIGAGDVFRNDGLAISADDVVGAIAVVHILPMVAHVVALRLLCTAGDADAILVVAGDICGNNCTAISTDDVVGAVAVVHIGPVVAHVVAGVLSTASAGALAVLTVDAGSSLGHDFAAVSADDLVSAVAIVLVGERGVLVSGLGVAADAGAGLKNAVHISVIDGAVLVDSMDVVVSSINRGVSSSDRLRRSDNFLCTADALAIGVNAGSSLGHDFAAVSADDLVSTVAVVLVGEAGVRAGIAADAGTGFKIACDVLIIDSAVLVDSVDMMVGGINRGIGGAGFFSRCLGFGIATSQTLTVRPDTISRLAVFFGAISIIVPDMMRCAAFRYILIMSNTVGRCGKRCRNHGQDHCACQHGGQQAAELFQFHKTISFTQQSFYSFNTLHPRSSMHGRQIPRISETSGRPATAPDRKQGNFHRKIIHSVTLLKKWWFSSSLLVCFYYSGSLHHCQG